MSDFRNYQTRSVPAGTRADAGIDEGLRAYMLKVYNLMGLGLLITGFFLFDQFFHIYIALVTRDIDTDNIAIRDIQCI